MKQPKEKSTEEKKAKVLRGVLVEEDNKLILQDKVDVKGLSYDREEELTKVLADSIGRRIEVKITELTERKKSGKKIPALKEAS